MEHHRDPDTQPNHSGGEPTGNEPFRALPVPGTEPPYDPEPETEPDIAPAEEDPHPEPGGDMDDEPPTLPHVFALYTHNLATGREYPYAWGIELSCGGAIVASATEGYAIGMFASAEGAVELLGMARDLWIVWPHEAPLNQWVISLRRLPPTEATHEQVQEALDAARDEMYGEEA